MSLDDHVWRPSATQWSRPRYSTHHTSHNHEQVLLTHICKQLIMFATLVVALLLAPLLTRREHVSV